MLYDERWGAAVEVLAPVEGWRGVLLDAADLIDERGWCQGDYSDERGRICAMTAVFMQQRWPGAAATAEAERRLRQHVNNSITHWNDTIARSQGEVTATLRECARGVSSRPGVEFSTG